MHILSVALHDICRIKAGILFKNSEKLVFSMLNSLNSRDVSYFALLSAYL